MSQSGVIALILTTADDRAILELCGLKVGDIVTRKNDGFWCGESLLQIEAHLAEKNYFEAFIMTNELDLLRSRREILRDVSQFLTEGIRLVMLYQHFRYSSLALGLQRSKSFMVVRKY